MTRVVLDEAVQAKLRDVDEVEFVDRSGRNVGHFLSEKVYRRLVYDWANARISDE